MGQQQLLLLVLCVAVVGIAIVVGIHALRANAEKARRDTATEETMRIVSHLQAWKLKPKAVGGGGGVVSPADFSGITLEALGYPVSETDRSYQTMNGCYVLTGTVDGSAISVHLESSGGSCSPLSRVAMVSIIGTGPNDIIWSHE